MSKLLILDGDRIETEIALPKDRFVFLLTDGGIYHIDLTDGNMWKARPDLSNLGDGHKKIVAERLYGILPGGDWVEK